MGWSKLHQSFLLGNKDTTLKLIKEASKEECEEEYWSLTPLHLAICANYEEAFDALIEKGVNFDTSFNLKRLRWFFAWCKRLNLILSDNTISPLSREYKDCKILDDFNPKIAETLMLSHLFNWIDKIFCLDDVTLSSVELVDYYSPLSLTMHLGRAKMKNDLISCGVKDETVFKSPHSLLYLEERKILNSVENQAFQYSISKTGYEGAIEEFGLSDIDVLSSVANTLSEESTAKNYIFPTNGSLSLWIDKIKVIYETGTLFHPNIEQVNADLFLFSDRILGEGSEGIVVLGNYKGIRVAVKIFKEASAYNRETGLYKKAYIEKVKTQEIIFIPTIKFKENESHAIVMPCFEVGSLKGFLKFLSTKEKSLFPLNLRIRMGLDIAIGLESLHQKGIAHRDIKSDNILLQPELSPIFIDFGFANEVSDKSSELGACGTAEYMAPEIFEEKESPDLYKADVYSFSILLWELLSGNYPYTCGVEEIEELSLPTDGEFTEEELIERRQRGICLLKDCVTDGMRPTIDKMWGDGVRKLLENCWNPNPVKRPDMKDVIEMITKL